MAPGPSLLEVGSGGQGWQGQSGSQLWGPLVPIALSGPDETEGAVVAAACEQRREGESPGSASSAFSPRSSDTAQMLRTRSVCAASSHTLRMVTFTADMFPEMPRSAWF